MQAFDASSMIYASDNYPVRQFPGLWEWIAGQIAKKILVMSDVALEKVPKEAPECSQWLEENNIKVRDVNNAIIQDAMRIKGLLGIVGDSYHPKGVGGKRHPHYRRGTRPWSGAGVGRRKTESVSR